MNRGDWAFNQSSQPWGHQTNRCLPDGGYPYGGGPYGPLAPHAPSAYQCDAYHGNQEGDDFANVFGRSYAATGKDGAFLFQNTSSLGWQQELFWLRARRQGVGSYDYLGAKTSRTGTHIENLGDSTFHQELFQGH